MTAENEIVDVKEQRFDSETDHHSRDTSENRSDPASHGSPVASGGSDGSSEPLGSSRGAIDMDVMFDILKNRRRRRVLEFLAEQQVSTTLGNLAEHLAAIENDKPREQLSSQERKRVYIGLYQFHLPRMDRAGVIEFDRHRGTIEACEALTAYRPYARTDQPYPTSPTAPAPLPSTFVLFGSAIVTALIVADVPGWITDGVILFSLSIVILLALAGLVLDRRLEIDRPLMRSPLP